MASVGGRRKRRHLPLTLDFIIEAQGFEGIVHELRFGLLFRLASARRNYFSFRKLRLEAFGLYLYDLHYFCSREHASTSAGAWIVLWIHEFGLASGSSQIVVATLGFQHAKVPGVYRRIIITWN